MSKLITTSLCTKDTLRVSRKQFAVVAQLVEHFHGKEEVPGSIPGNGSS